MKLRSLTIAALFCECALMPLLYAKHLKESSATQQKKNQSLTTVKIESTPGLIDDALKNIREKLQIKTSKGRPCRIDCSYEIINNIFATTKVKVFYSGYRQPPDLYEIQNSKPEQAKEKTTDEIITVIYKATDKDHLSMVGRDPHKNKKLLFSKVVPISPNQLHI